MDNFRILEKFVYNDTKNTLNRSSKSISLRTFLCPLGDFLNILLHCQKVRMGGGLKMGNFNSKNTQFFDIKGKMGVVSHICIYKIKKNYENFRIFSLPCTFLNHPNLTHCL